METLLPLFEREGIRVEIQAHPWDFCEESDETVNMVKSFRSDNVKYVYSVPHTFFYDKGKGDVEKMLRHAGHDLSHVLIADTMNHTKHCRYIVNPPGVDATIHQHVGIGEGEVDFDNAVPNVAGNEVCRADVQSRGRAYCGRIAFWLSGKNEVSGRETRERIERELLTPHP